MNAANGGLAQKNDFPNPFRGFYAESDVVNK